MCVEWDCAGAARLHSPLSMFLAEVDKNVAAVAEKMVFLATDDELTERSFAQRYGSKVLIRRLSECA